MIESKLQKIIETGDSDLVSVRVSVLSPLIDLIKANPDKAIQSLKRIVNYPPTLTLEIKRDTLRAILGKPAVVAPVVEPVVTPEVVTPAVDPVVTPELVAPAVEPVVTPEVVAPAVEPVVTPEVVAPAVEPVVTPEVVAPAVDPVVTPEAPKPKRKKRL